MRTRKKSVFRRIFGASPEGMILIDSTGLCLSANSAAVRTLFAQPTNVRGEAATALYRILQEALNNVSRYSNASKVSVSLLPKAKRIHLSIRDNGVGFDPSLLRMEKSLGLSGMKERALLLGGKFQFESSPGEGTEIRVWLPAFSGQK